MPKDRAWQIFLAAYLLAHKPISVLGAVQRANSSTNGRPTWINLRAEPEGYGIVPVPAFPLDQPFPGLTDTVSSGWQLEVRFQLSMLNTSSSQTRTIITHGLLPPAAYTSDGNFSVPQNASSTWTLWVASMADFNIIDLPEVEEGNNKDNGSCPDSALSFACQNELKEAIRTDSAVTAGSGVIKSSSTREKTPSCDSTWVGYRLEEVSLDNPRNFNRSTTWRTSDWIVDEDEALWPFNRFGVKTWPLIFVWGHSNTSSEVGQPLSADHVVIACVKVDKVASGMEMPTGSAGSWARLRGGAVGKAVVAVLGVVWWCM